VVLTSDFLLAAGVAGADSVSPGVADSVAFPNCGNSGGGSFGIAARNFLFAGAGAARTAGCVNVIGIAIGLASE
jgi:hypothetical protein